MFPPPLLHKWLFTVHQMPQNQTSQTCLKVYGSFTNICHGRYALGPKFEGNRGCYVTDGMRITLVEG